LGGNCTEKIAYERNQRTRGKRLARSTGEEGAPRVPVTDSRRKSAYRFGEKRNRQSPDRIPPLLWFGLWGEKGKFAHIEEGLAGHTGIYKTKRALLKGREGKELICLSGGRKRKGIGCSI